MSSVYISNEIPKYKSSTDIVTFKCDCGNIFKEIYELYEKFHYIGKCDSKINYGIYYNDEIIAGVSFRKPSRQNIKYEYEISRMVADPRYKIHGVWSKLIKIFIADHKPKSIVSYSDNRLFSGDVYEKMGMRYDGKINQDYYWVLKNKRYHKSSLRKEKGSDLTETELRENQGYRKIWDCGKKRWVLSNVMDE